MAPSLQSPTSSVSFPNSSSLPFPSSLRHNRSFVKLANLLGLASTVGSSTSHKDDVNAKVSGGSVGHHEGGQDGEDGDEDEDEGEIDEDSLLWDAQTALIAHQPALAIQHYTIAALPPYRSSPACLALGNLLTRGSGLAPPPLTPAESTPAPRFTASEKGKGRAYSFGPASPPLPSSPSLPKQDLRRGSAGTIPPTSPSQSAMSRFMGFVWPTSPPETVTVSPPDRTYTDLAGTGWVIPKEGKRAVRDVEGMGIAGGWFVLGLGWIVDGQISMAEVGSDQADRTEAIQEESEGDEDALVMGTKSGSRSRQSPIMRSVDLVKVERASKSDDTEESNSSEGTILKTPPQEDEGELKEDKALTIKLMPLLRLYRNGHIQSSDPVYLPPITFAQLPTCLRPQGDLQKRRNAWNLGGTVLKKLLDLEIMRDEADDQKIVIARRRGVEIMARYISAMTGPSAESEDHYRKIITLGQSGLEYPDEIVRHAARHLDIITSPPGCTPQLVPHTSRRGEYPFPTITSSAEHLQTPTRNFTSPSRIKRSRHTQRESISSIRSSCSTRILETPLKSYPSVPSLTEASSAPAPLVGVSGAEKTLRRVQVQSAVDLVSVGQGEDGFQAWWPSISSWSYTKAKEKLSPASSGSNTPTAATSRSESHTEDVVKSKVEASRPTAIVISLPTPSPTDPTETRPPIPTIRTVASTPTFGSLRMSSAVPSKPSSANLTPRPFDHLHSEINLTMDPALAAAELASTLTKRVKCGVCRTEGINFPGCRRCALVFCSRECRVAVDKAGDGKRHVCGAWERRKGLGVPEVQGASSGVRKMSDAGRVVLAC